MNNQLSHYLSLVQQLQARLNVSSFEIEVHRDMIFCYVDTNGSIRSTREYFQFSEQYEKERNEREYLRLRQIIDNV